MKTWNTDFSIDKSNWRRGEWDSEPDKAHWIDEETGLDCLIVRNKVGGLCGYVGVPEEHKFFGKNYEEVPVEVHGGLTFADKCADTEDESQGICHSKECAANETVWWLGFDCVHGWDDYPVNGCRSAAEVYRNFDYVQGEVAQLAAQLKTG